MKATILWVEGKRVDSPLFISALKKKDFQVETVYTGTDALQKATELNPDLIIVNASTSRTNGKRVCATLRAKLAGMPIILITSKEHGDTKDAKVDSVLVMPFTNRKLLNRIAPYVPGNSSRIVRAGPFRLDLERHQVNCRGVEKRLTPRLTTLMHLLMQHPGEVVGREQLFREAWDTEYTGDTRTLDVHISWLRKEIEEDPRHPRYLKTIRQIGYRLDV